MGYLTSLSGELEIVPPLTKAEFKDSPFTTWDHPDGAEILRVRLEVEITETDEGALTVHTGETVEVWEDSVKAYDIEKQLQSLVDAFPGHEFRGCIHGEGEDNGDMWRLYVVAGRVVKVEPTIAWPDAPTDSGTGN